MNENMEDIIKKIESLTLLEALEMVRVLEQRWGVSAAAVAVGAPAASDTGSEGAAKKDSFNVTLSNVGPNKIAVIKEIKEIMGLGLKESKDLVEKAPVVIKEKASSSEAEDLKNRLQGAGATVEIK